jgi:hypothetical protein
MQASSYDTETPGHGDEFDQEPSAPLVILQTPTVYIFSNAFPQQNYVIVLDNPSTTAWF